MTEFTKFDVSEYLNSDEAMREYLAVCLEDEDPKVFVAALGHVAKARGMSQVAELSGLGRESLYKALKPGSKLRYETVQKVLHALGFKLSVEVALDAANRIRKCAAGEKLTAYDPAESLQSEEAVAAFMDDALMTEDAGYVANAREVAARAMIKRANKQ